jgi:predicted ester cyclase
VTVQPGAHGVDGVIISPATGKKVQFATSDFYRIERGKVVEHWDVVDSLPRTVALGLVPAPGPN